MSDWQGIESAPKDDLRCAPGVDLWLHIPASPRSMGFSDSFRVTECWVNADGNWVHYANGKIVELVQDYITHWMPLPPPPGAKDESAT